MKEQREMQTHIDELNAHIKLQDSEIESLHRMLNNVTSLAPSIARDAARYRWLRKYTGQMFMATERQVDVEVDRAMGGSHEYIKRSGMVGRVFLLSTCFDYMGVA